MVDESPNEDYEVPSDDVVSVPEILLDLVTDTAIPGLPAPVRRNLFKALGQFCSAAIDIPVAYLTGKADERRAETTARIKLIDTSASQIAQQMQTDPEYARVAVQKFGQRVLREQVNLDLISQNAASEIRDAIESDDQTEPDESGETISDDWLNAFEAEARQKSTEEMQAYFGKVLAGEIRKPGTYSTRVVKILGSLDKNVAEHFVRLCSLSISQLEDARVPSLKGNAASNSLQQYGLNFDALNLLNEYGLVISDFNSWREYVPCVNVPEAEQQVVFIPIRYQGKHWLLIPNSNDVVGKKLRIHGVALTRAGRELSRIVNVVTIDGFPEELRRFFASNGYRMVEVDDGQPRVLNVDVLTTVQSQ